MSRGGARADQRVSLITSGVVKITQGRLEGLSETVADMAGFEL
jgi:hypothetical protein